MDRSTLARSVGLVVVGLLVGFGLAWWQSSSTTVATGRADPTADGGGSITTDDWTYGFPAGVAWMDEAGTWHTGGDQPACLEPGESVNVRFAAVNASVEGMTWRPVVWIDCRGATPYVEP